ncbi:MAG: penicillin-binding transpeptidase domain-containing protein [Candidatus Sulfotelmatobacter sp.]
MVAIRHFALLLALVPIVLSPSNGRAGARTQEQTKEQIGEPAYAPHQSLFAQSAAEALNRNFSSRDISFLLLDARTGDVLAARWDHVDSPHPLGSLVKPFTALAYGEQHDFRYPAHTCLGTATGCWLPRGHGEIGLTAAIAYSCNSYFRMLTANLTGADVAPIAARFGIESPDRDASGPALAGIGSRWQISPLRMARAYVELIRRREQLGVREILAGMAQSARHGTGAEVDRALPFPDALAKTGTAPCTHSPRAPGDGFVVVLAPADQPQILLMVRVHGVPGAQAAKTAGQMLRRIEGRFRNDH